MFHHYPKSHTLWYQVLWCALKLFLIIKIYFKNLFDFFPICILQNFQGLLVWPVKMVKVSTCSLSYTLQCIFSHPYCSLSLNCTPEIGSPAWLTPPVWRQAWCKCSINVERIVIRMNGVSCDKLFFHGKGIYSDFFFCVYIKWSWNVFTSVLFLNFTVYLMSWAYSIVPVWASYAAVMRMPRPVSFPHCLHFWWADPGNS